MPTGFVGEEDGFVREKGGPTPEAFFDSCGIGETLKGKHINVVQRGRKYFFRDRSVGVIAIPQNEVVRIVAFDGGSRDLVIGGC